jgi:hypothetical protein
MAAHPDAIETNRAFARYRLCAQPSDGEHPMDINPQLLSPIVALVAGILILIVPRLLNYIVAIYLIFIGVVGLMGRF